MNQKQGASTFDTYGTYGNEQGHVPSNGVCSGPYASFWCGPQRSEIGGMTCFRSTIFKERVSVT